MMKKNVIKYLEQRFLTHCLFSRHLNLGLDFVREACPFGLPQIGLIGLLVTGNNTMCNKQRRTLRGLECIYQAIKTFSLVYSVFHSEDL